MMKRVLLTTLCLISVSSLFIGCAHKTEPTPDSTTVPEETVNINAEALYKQNCISCHGTNLEGILPGKTNLQKVGAKLTKDQIVNKIQNGGNGMPPFKNTLQNEEINTLADWLATQK